MDHLLQSQANAHPPWCCLDDIGKGAVIKSASALCCGFKKRNQWQPCCSVSLCWGWSEVTLLLFYQQHMEECKFGKQTLSLHIAVHHWHQQQYVWPDPLNWYCNHPGCFGAEREREEKKEPGQYNVHTNYPECTFTGLILELKCPVHP